MTVDFDACALSFHIIDHGSAFIDLQFDTCSLVFISPQQIYEPLIPVYAHGHRIPILDIVPLDADFFAAVSRPGYFNACTISFEILDHDSAFIDLRFCTGTGGVIHLYSICGACFGIAFLSILCLIPYFHAGVVIVFPPALNSVPDTSNPNPPALNISN